MNKRIMSLALALMMVLGTFTTVFAADTSVLPEEMNAEWAGQFLKENKILTGDDEGELKLEENLLRKDSVFILARLLNKEAELEATEADAEAFTDLTENPVYNKAITWAKEDELVEGNEDGSFGGEDQLTAGQYSTILVRALGYESKGADAWAIIMDVASHHDLFNGMEKPEKDHKLTRGEMAIMTFNALGAEMNEPAGITLAEHLGIKLPEAPVAEELKVEKVRTENLKEVIVEFNNAKVDEKQAKEIANAKNYSVSHATVKEVVVNENTVIVVLKDALVRDRDYKLTIRNIASTVNRKYSFKGADNTAPTVEKVEVLGNYGIKVVMSEPVREAQETSFLLDGRNVAMTLSQHGREITLMPYHKEAFKLGEHTLTIKPLVDFAGFKSAEVDKDIVIKEYNELPEVESITATNNSVIVEFNMDVFPKSVDKSNATWSQVKGRRDVKATSAEVLSGNKVEYKFEKGNELPRRDVEVTISGVENYSRKVMKTETLSVVADLDFTRPEIVRHFVKTNTKGNIVTMELVFDKDMDNMAREINEDLKEIEKSPEHKKKAAKYINLYEHKIDRFGDIEIGEIIYDGVKEVEIEGKVVTVTFADNIIESGETYFLTVEGLRDDTVLKNTMIALGKSEAIEFREGHDKPFYVSGVDGEIVRDELVLDLIFPKSVRPVDRYIAEQGQNYVFTLANGQKRDLKELGGRVIVSRDGYKVTLELGDRVKPEEVLELELITTIKDVDGVRLSNHNLNWELNVNVEDGKVNPQVKEETNKDPIINAKEAVAALFANSNKKELAEGVNAETIEKAEALVNMLNEGATKEALLKDIKKAKELLGAKNLGEAKENLEKEIKLAREVLGTLEEDSSEAKDLALAILNAEKVLNDKEANKEQLDGAIQKLQEATELKVDTVTADNDKDPKEVVVTYNRALTAEETAKVPTADGVTFKEAKVEGKVYTYEVENLPEATKDKQEIKVEVEGYTGDDVKIVIPAQVAKTVEFEIEPKEVNIPTDATDATAEIKNIVVKDKDGKEIEDYDTTKLVFVKDEANKDDKITVTGKTITVSKEAQVATVTIKVEGLEGTATLEVK